MKKKITKKIRLNTYILLDRSGSMSGRWDETLSSINAYVKALDRKVINKVTVATFDTQNSFQFDVIRDNKDAGSFQPVTDKDAAPRGWTPLYDAIGRIVAKADEDADEKAIIVIMTDGAENASTELNKDQAKAALDRCRNKGWEVVFLGADFDAMTQGASVGNSLDKSLNMTAGNYTVTMRNMASKSTLYATADCAVAFSAADRVEATKKDTL